MNPGSSSTDVSLGTGLIGSEHTYRIEWTSSEIRFFVDNALRDTRTTAITAQLRPVVSDYQAGAPALSVDWLRMTPYASGGTYESRVFDAGQLAGWQQLSADTITPSGTGFGFEFRAGDVATPDGTWTGWTTVPPSGALGVNARYFQYRANLITTDATLTPIVRQVELTLGEPITNVAPSLGAIGNQSRGRGRQPAARP